MSKSVRSTKHTPLSQARIDRILANNPNTSAETLTTLKVVSESKPSIVLKSAENQVLDYNTLHPEAELKSFLDFLRNAESRYQADCTRENDLNQETQDILHLMELSENMNACKGYKAYKTLSNVRRERRQCKNEIELLETIYKFIEDNRPVIRQLEQVLGKIRNTKQAIDNRSYLMRTDITSAI